MSDVNYKDKLDKITYQENKIIKACKNNCDDGYIYTDEEDDEVLLHPKRNLCDCRNKFYKVLNYILANVPRIFWYKNKFDDIECREYLFEKEKLGRVKKFKPIYDKFISNKKLVLDNGFSFLFSGMNGTGKTYTSANMIKSFVDCGYDYCYYIHFRELLDYYYKGIIGRDKTNRDMFNYIIKADLLCIDEIGKENNATTVVLGEFEYWLKTRLESNKSTILITNRSLIKKDDASDFLSSYGESIWDIFKQTWRLFVFNPSSDFRLKDRKNWSILK